MNKLLPILLLAASVPAFAGHPIEEDKNPVEGLYGTGFYFGLQAGANLYQDMDSGRVDVAGIGLDIDFDSNVGGLVGLKLGYVFGTGPVRPAIEFDGYFNAFQTDVDFRASVPGFGVLRGEAEASIKSGAFLANFLLRVNCHNPFQLYFGGGVGLYYANVEATGGAGGVAATDSDDDTGLAWQLLGGADYYFSERSSLFLEYKFLNYESDDFADIDGAIRQHLVALGFRVHF